MAVLAIELNDAGIRAAKDTEPGMEAFPASPGIVLWDGDALITGREASRRARLKPRWSHDRFWQELDTTPLSSPFPPNVRRADLVHAHLEEIWSATKSDVDEVLLAIPGSFSTEQLCLILGISRSCEMPVSGMVDQGVAASLLADKNTTLVHLDLHLHRTVATKVRRGATLERIATVVDDQAGMLSLFDTWVKLIAQVFIRTTRFDPLHRGETEQLLYRRLPEWLDELRQKESTVLKMEGTDKDYSAELTREQIVSAAQPFLERIVQLARSAQTAGEPATLLLTPAVADLPGLVESLRGSDADVVSLPAAAAAMGALKAKKAIRSASSKGSKGRQGDQGEALSFITQLPVGTPPPEEEARPRKWAPPKIDHEIDHAGGTDSGSWPTHVLCDGLAHAITSRPLVLGLEIPADERGIDLSTLSGSTAGISRSHCTIYELDGRVVLEDHSSYGSFLNDTRVEEKATLAAGDRLRLGTPGIELRLIKLADSNGTPPKD